MATIAITHPALEGHIGPATRVGAVLVRQGHRVHAWAPAEHRRQIERTGATFHAHAPVPREQIRGGLTGFAAACGEATVAGVERLCAELLEADVDLVIHDTHAPWGRVAAEFLGLARICSHTMYPVIGGDQRPADGRAPRLISFGSADALARAQAARTSILERWGVDLGDWRGLVYSGARLTLTYTTAEITGELELPAGFSYAGPLLGPGPSPGPRGDSPLVYVSLGTFYNFVPEVYGAILKAFAGEPFEVVISTGAGAIAAADLGSLPSNVRARDWVAARELLARASVFVTHCGANSVHESLLAGVPMLCIPQAHDQFAWAARIRALGAGLFVEAVPKQLRRGVSTLLDDPRPRGRAAELGRHLCAYEGPRRVSELVEEALGARRSQS